MLSATNMVMLRARMIALDAALCAGSTTKMNLCQAVNSAMRIAMRTDNTACHFGEDVAFGGVFRCSIGMQVSRKMLN